MMNKTRRFRTVCGLAALALLTGLPALARDPRPSWLTPHRSDNGETEAGENAALREWFSGWGDFMNHHREVRRLQAEQDRVIDEMAKVQAAPGTAPTLGDLAERRRRREAMRQLHGLEQRILEHEQAMEATARALAAQAGGVGEELKTLRAKTLAPAGEDQATTTTDPRLARRVERIDRMIELAEAMAADPGRAAQTMDAALSEIDKAPDDKAPPSFGALRLRERIEGLEREQRFLRQRLESNEASLRDLQEDLERLGELYRRRRMPRTDPRTRRQAPPGVGGPDNP